MKKILVFCDYYRPSTKSGGGMWTVANLVDRFSDRYEFHIVTRNYDSPGDTTPYTTVRAGEWNEVGEARVYYAASTDLRKQTCARLVNEVGPDCVFLNSVFSTPAVKFLMARRGGMTTEVPVVVAPCGELSVGCLRSRSIKKKIYLAYARAAELYRDVLWKASTSVEAREIQKIFGRTLEPMIAPDLTPKEILPEFTIDEKPIKQPGDARFIFLSRIVPKKNLGYLLERLHEVKSGTATLEIVGPAEDQPYWNSCEQLIRSMPERISVRVHGSVDYSEGLALLVSSHFFVLPTLNENFGYVFIESLSAGTPIVISEHTVWDDITAHNAGWVLPLDDPKGWVETIERCIAMGNEQYSRMAAAARNYAVNWLDDKELENATARVLEIALASRSISASNGQ